MSLSEKRDGIPSEGVVDDTAASAQVDHDREELRMRKCENEI